MSGIKRSEIASFYRSGAWNWKRVVIRTKDVPAGQPWRWMIGQSLLVFMFYLADVGLWPLSGYANEISENNRKTETTSLAEWLKEVEIAVRIHADPLNRTIVCQVPYTDVSVRTISLATGLTGREVILAAAKLRDWGLVKFLPNEKGAPIIAPANEKYRKLMRSWAEQWCAQDDKCNAFP